uniref:Uncharacterized protein n=1 Tax=Arundo donax TaxID=35708 RepID=A0A0A9ABS4_ARUDO
MSLAVLPPLDISKGSLKDGDYRVHINQGCSRQERNLSFSKQHDKKDISPSIQNSLLDDHFHGLSRQLHTSSIHFSTYLQCSRRLPKQLFDGNV